MSIINFKFNRFHFFPVDTDPATLHQFPGLSLARCNTGFCQERNNIKTRNDFFFIEINNFKRNRIVNFNKIINIVLIYYEF